MPTQLLLVDDYLPSAQALAGLLLEEGFACDCVGSGEAALERLHAGGIDLVLLDVAMEGMSGLDVLREIRRTTALTDLPVIMVTARDAGVEVARALALGANDYVTKPIDLDVLLARIRTQQSLLALAKLKDEFLRIATHDLKNPLGSILLAADSLVEDFPDGTVMTRDGVTAATTIVKSARRMRALIHDFLEMQALEDGHLSLALADADLGELAAAVVESQRDYASSKRITLAYVPHAPGSIASQIDRARIEQVMQNLVGNAIKFSPPDARVTVRLVAASPPQRLRFEVEDQGPGIAAEDRPKLFVKHAHLTNRPTGGEHSSGLGLAICKRLVEEHRGRIGADERPLGSGALFFFELP